MIKKYLNFFTDTKGAALSQTVLVSFILLILILPTYNYCKSLLIANSVKNAFRSEMICAVTQNYYPAFNGMREGNSGVYKQNGAVWQDCVVKDNAVQNIANRLSLHQSGSELVKSDANGVKQYGLSNITVTVNNADIASNNKKFNVHGEFVLSIPLSFLNLQSEENIPIHIDTEFEQKF